MGAFFLAGAVCFALLYGLTNSGHSDRYLLPLAILFVPLLEIMLADCTPLHRPDARGLTALMAAILLLRAEQTTAQRQWQPTPTKGRHSSWCRTATETGTLLFGTVM